MFEIDTVNNRIDRQDRTFYQGYNFDAYQFQRNDTIFSFGGYGFWLENNLLTYFSEVRRSGTLCPTHLFLLIYLKEEIE